MQNNQHSSYTDKTVVIQYNMTNDYMFRYILQKNHKVLLGLICALLHLKPEEILSVEIKNPIDLSQNITGKDFILDIKVLLNNNQLLNLEMQVKNEFNWADRSLTYLCRTFDQLQSGQEYEETLPVIHIGFTAFTLFPDNPEFYATYRMINIRNHTQVYSDKFTLSVVDLTQIDNATNEDKSSKIDYWARLFKAKTWEELQMLAQNDEYLQEAATSIRIANEAEIVREQCRAREDALRLERTLKRDNKRLLEENALLQNEKASLQDELISLQDEKVSLQDENTLLQDKNASLQDELISLRKQLSEFQAQNSK